MTLPPDDADGKHDSSSASSDRPASASRASSTGSAWLHALRVAGPFVLVVGSAWPAPLLTVFTLTLTGDRLLGLAALTAAVVVGLRERWRWTTVHTALALFVGVQVMTSMLSAATWPQGQKFATVYVLGLACFVLAADWARGADGQRRMASAWITVAALVSIVGTVMANLSNVYQRPLWGTGPAQILSEAPRQLLLFGPQVTFGEWNLFSGFLLVPFALSLWLWQRNGGRQRGRVVALGAFVFGLITGITRAAWLSMAALVVLWIWTKRPPPSQLATLGSILAAALVVQALCLGVSPVWQRGVELSTLTYRFVVNHATGDAWLKRPLVGHGAGSVNRLQPALPAGTQTTKIWTGNVVLFVLHDSGVLGLVTLLGVVVAVCHRAWRALGRGARAPTPSLVVPLVASGAALAFAYQFTHALWLMYPYVYLGFLTAATDPAGNDA